MPTPPPLPTPEYPEDPDDEYNHETDWQEVTDNAQPGDGVSLSAQSQDATLVGYVPWNKQRSAARAILGYSYADPTSPYRLHREPPLPHPIWPTMRAHSVNFKGLVLQANEANENSSPFDTSPFAGPGGSILYNARYEKAITSIRYRSFGRMRFLEDADIEDYRDEYKRWCTVSTDPQSEVLSADNAAQLVFNEGGGDPHPTAGTTMFPAPLAELLARVKLALTWHLVPHDYISNDRDFLYPNKIVDRLGKVNAEGMLGYRAGTLLLLAVKFEEALFPVMPADETNPLTGWNVTFMFDAFDPPKGVANEPSGTSPYFGHNLMPWRKTGKFYFCERLDNSSTLIPTTDMMKIFQHQADSS